MAELVMASKLAEAVVSQAVERITELLYYEAASLSAVRVDIEFLKSELTWMQCFLKDADRKQEQDELVRKWVAEVRDVACAIEDAVETYIFKAQNSAYYGKAYFLLRKLRSQINSIKEKLKSISERTQRYGINFNRSERISNGNYSAASMTSLRRSYPDEGDDDDDDVVSLRSSLVALKGQLLKEEDRRCIVSIVGMGGLGKTTLARKVYNDIDVKKHFDCCAWVFISQQYGVRDLLTEIIIQVGFQSRRKEKMDRTEVMELWKKTNRKELLEKLIQGERERLNVAKDKELIDRLKRELQEERYLVVLDDIWSIEAWNAMKSAFPRGKVGSKIVFTTRNKEIAVIADPYSLHIEPPFLTDTESWELLLRKAFPKNVFPGHECSQEFDKLGKEMVKKCGGLPLAIVTLGGLLRTKNSLDGWKKVHRSVNSHLVRSRSHQVQYGVEEMLALSYHDLPYHLKPCFLYLGSFSEYWEIPKGKLIRLWIAEGFITTATSEAEETLEEVGERYLEELIDRCMVQVAKRDHNGTGVKLCRMHDLMRNFCVSKAKEDSFFEIIEQPEMKMLTTNSFFSRRVAVHLGSHFEMNQVHSQLRSLLWSDIYDCLNTTLLRNKKFRLLRVLELGSTRHKQILRQMPIELGNLVHLRYLGLRNAEISKLPPSIGKLRNLHTLDLRMKMLAHSLPESVSRLTRLRHLFLPDYRHTTDLKWSSCRSGMENLTNIQTLKHITAESLIKDGMFIKLANLQSLVIQFKSIPEARLVMESPVFQVGRLRSLEMYMHNNNAFPSLKSLSHCQFLSKLCLAGKIRSGSGYSDHFLQFLPCSLTKLMLRYTEIKQEGIAVLERLLHNLRFLLLGYDSYSGSEMVLSANGFPRLETLQLFGLFQLEDWQVRQGSLPSLKRLDIEYIPKLSNVPHGLMYITTLQELNVVRMNRLEDRLQVIDGIEGADYYKVRHIPSISFLTTSLSHNLVGCTPGLGHLLQWL